MNHRTSLLALALAAAWGTLGACSRFDSATEPPAPDDGDAETTASDAGDASITTHGEAGEADAGCVPPPSCVDPQALACPGIDGRCIFLCSEAPWSLAFATCQQWGGCLAGLESDLARDCLAEKARELTSQFIWLDFVQGAGTDAGWGSACTTVATAVVWGPDQPDDGDGFENGAQNCGLLVEGKVHDDECTSRHRFVCARPR